MVGSTTETEVYDYLINKPDVTDPNFVLANLQSCGIFITFQKSQDRSVLALDDKGQVYEEKICNIPGFSMQPQRDKPVLYTSRDLDEVNAKRLLEKTIRTTHENQALRKRVVWGHGIYQINAYAAAPTDPAHISVDKTVHTDPTKPAHGRGKSIGMATDSERPEFGEHGCYPTPPERFKELFLPCMREEDYASVSDIHIRLHKRHEHFKVAYFIECFDTPVDLQYLTGMNPEA